MERVQRPMADMDRGFRSGGEPDPLDRGVPTFVGDGSDELTTRQLTQLQLAWIRFRRHRLALVGSAILAFMVLMALFAPLIAPENIYDPNGTDVFGTPDQAPTLAHGLRYLFGSDLNNHSMTAEIIYGAR